MRIWAAVAAVCAWATLCQPATSEGAPKGWAIGLEREHHAGSYSTYWGSIDGWHLWSIELNTGRVCRANKGQALPAEPVPVYMGIFDQPGPFVSFLDVEGVGTISAMYVDGYPRVAQEYRAPNDRFFRKYDGLKADWTDYDDLALEFHVAGFDDRELSTGYFDYRFFVDMAGAAEARAWIAVCRSDQPYPK